MTSDNHVTGLKPCPFCEGPVYKHALGDVDGCVHIGMPHCPVESHRVMTIEQWCTRQPPPPDEAMRQAFMEGWSAATDDNGTPYPDEAWEHSRARATLSIGRSRVGQHKDIGGGE